MSYKSVYKSTMANYYDISLTALRTRFEIMEDEKVISKAWRRIKKLTPGMVESFVNYWGEPARASGLREKM